MNVYSLYSKFSFHKKNIKYILILVFIYLFFLVINLPATIALSVINLPGNLSLSTVSGTVWSGNVKKINYSGVELGSANWKLHPLNLILGELSADVSVVNKKQFINTQLNISPSGKMELEETRFYIDLSLLQPLTYGMPFSYTGKATGYFPVSFFYKNNYIGINGKLSLTDIEMTSPQRQPFGSFTVDFRAEKEGATSGYIKDKGAELNIDGNIALDKSGQFTLSAKLAAQHAGSPLESMISFLGRKDNSGDVLLNTNFKLWH